MNALKLSLVLPAGLDYVPALRTFLRRVPRININNRTPVCLSFVNKKLFKLIKGPTMKSSSLITSLFTPLSNVLQVLKNYYRPSRKTLDDFLRDTMAHVLTKTVLLLGNFLKVSFRGTRPTRLELGPQSQVSIRNSFNSSSTKKLFVTSHGKTSDTTIDSHDVRIRQDLVIWDSFLKNKSKEYFTLTINKISRFTAPVSELVKIIIGLKFNTFYTPFYVRIETSFLSNHKEWDWESNLMEHNLDLGQEVFFFFFNRARTDFKDSVAFIRAEVQSWAGRVFLSSGYTR